MRLFRFLNGFLFHSGLSGISFVQIETSSSLFTVSSEAPEFMRLYSQQQCVKESEILQNTMKSYQSIFIFLFKMHIWQYHISPHKFNSKAAGALI